MGDPVKKITNLNSISRINMVEGKNKFYEVVHLTPHAFCDIHTQIHTKMFK